MASADKISSIVIRIERHDAQIYCDDISDPSTIGTKDGLQEGPFGTQESDSKIPALSAFREYVDTATLFVGFAIAARAFSHTSIPLLLGSIEHCLKGLLSIDLQLAIL